MSRTQLRKPFCLFRFGHVHVLVETRCILLSLHFCFFDYRWKVSILVRNFKLDVCAGGGSFWRSCCGCFLLRVCRRRRRCRGRFFLRRLSRRLRSSSSSAFFSLFRRSLCRLFCCFCRLHDSSAFFSLLESSRGRCHGITTKRGSRPLLVLKRRGSALTPVCLFILARMHEWIIVDIIWVVSLRYGGYIIIIISLWWLWEDDTRYCDVKQQQSRENERTRTRGIETYCFDDASRWVYFSMTCVRRLS